MYINSFQFRMEYPIMELLTRDLHYGNRHFNGVKPFFIDNRPCEFDSLLGFTRLQYRESIVKHYG